MAITFVKDPNSTNLDFSVNWNDGYLQSGESISASTWMVTPPGMDIANSTFSGNIATVYLDGGVHGVTYNVRNRIVTSEGRGDDRVLRITVWEPL